MIPVFQSEEFYRFLESAGILEPFRFTVMRGERVVGIIQGFIQRDGGLVKRFLSRRAIINGGPWLDDDITENELELLLRKCVEGLRHRAIYIETRNFADYSRWKEIFERTGFRYEPHYDIIVGLHGPDQWEKRLESSRTRFVKSSLKSGAEIVGSPTEADVISYYDILRELYRNKVRTPLFPLAFFLKLYNAPFCRFILVRYKDEIIGGTVCIFDEVRAYEWFVCGKDGVFKHIYPSTVATYHAIRFAYDKGLKSFDMMGAGSPGDGGYGVREFKLKFGGELREYGRYRYISDKPLYTAGKLAVSVIKRLK